jgi:hypothetical protein
MDGGEEVVDQSQRRCLAGGFRTGKSLLLLLSVVALLYVGIQSRLALRLPGGGTNDYLTLGSDPVKFPPPEEKLAAPVFVVEVPVGVVLESPRFRSFEEPGIASAAPDQCSGIGNPLRAPPVSL